MSHEDLTLDCPRAGRKQARRLPSALLRLLSEARLHRPRALATDMVCLRAVENTI